MDGDLLQGSWTEEDTSLAVGTIKHDKDWPTRGVGGEEVSLSSPRRRRWGDRRSRRWQGALINDLSWQNLETIERSVTWACRFQKS